MENDSEHDCYARLRMSVPSNSLLFLFWQCDTETEYSFFVDDTSSCRVMLFIRVMMI